ncbi:MAG: hypothetical protein ACO1TE_03845 [Prosthecobacter sp.]
MIVPEFWAEARVQHKVPGRQVTVRRFGWSDTSEEEALAMGEARAQEALGRILAGDSRLERRESKVSYNGADGMPIREEIIARHGDTIITRNIYGALCLNTPNVLFVDVDHDQGPRFTFSFYPSLILLAGAASYGVHHRSFWSFVICFAGLSVLMNIVLNIMNSIHRRIGEKPSARALRRIEWFSTAHHEWHLRVYETPAGLRVLVMHDVFDPSSPEVAEIFQDLHADPVYVRMCQNQRCFRARVSPKPWRIGISQHIRPRPGYWPVKPEHLPRRHQWVAAYEEKAKTHASCRFLRTYGSSRVHPEAEAVRNLHDELSRANSGLPLA